MALYQGGNNSYFPYVPFLFALTFLSCYLNTPFSDCIGIQDFQFSSKEHIRIICYLALIKILVDIYRPDWILPRDSQVAQWQRICLQCRKHQFHPWVSKIPWRRKWQPTPVFMPDRGAWQATVHGVTESWT